MTTGSLIRLLMKYPEDAEIYVTCNTMEQESEIDITTDYDRDGNTLDIEIF